MACCISCEDTGCFTNPTQTTKYRKGVPELVVEKSSGNPKRPTPGPKPDRGVFSSVQFVCILVVMISHGSIKGPHLKSHSKRQSMKRGNLEKTMSVIKHVQRREQLPVTLVQKFKGSSLLLQFDVAVSILVYTVCKSNCMVVYLFLLHVYHV